MRRLRLPESTILVTGAASGIGRACARALHGAGARLVLTDLAGPGLAAVVEELGDDRVMSVVADVTDYASMCDVVAAAVARFGALHVVFANAGIAADPPMTMATIDHAAFERVLEVDLQGVWRTVKAGLPQITANHGHVLVTSSIYSFINGVINAPYAAAKAAVESLGRSLRVELASHGASAGVLYPGWIQTPIIHNAFGDDLLVTKLREAGYPGALGRPVPPEQVAAAVVRGIERRTASIVVPRIWHPLSLSRGIVNPLIDSSLRRRRRVQQLLGEIERRHDV